MGRIAQGENTGGLLKDPLALQRSQQKNSLVANVGHSKTTDLICVKTKKTLYDETFEEWRSAFTRVLLVSMLSGVKISALKNEEVL